MVWGDLVEVAADQHVTGHYQSVVPAAAELALDHAMSGGPRPLITEHTKLGWIEAQSGQVTYFPCKAGRVRSAAVVGMGPMGTLKERRAVQMYASLLGEDLALAGLAGPAVAAARDDTPGGPDPPAGEQALSTVLAAFEPPIRGQRPGTSRCPSGCSYGWASAACAGRR